MTTDVVSEFVAVLHGLDATDDEIETLLLDTEFEDVVDASTLAHDRLASLRRVPSIA